MGQNEEETSEWIGEMGREWTEEERSLGGVGGRRNEGKDRWAGWWVAGLRGEYSLFFSFVSPPKLLFFHPIFHENMAGNYASSSPLTVGMTYTLYPDS